MVLTKGSTLEFRRIAELAGHLLKPETEDGVITWLEALRDNGVNFRLRRDSGDPGTQGELIVGTISRLCNASDDLCVQLEIESTKVAKATDIEMSPAPVSPSTEQPSDAVSADASISTSSVRKSFVEPLLEAKGWSVLDWANESKVDFHTANDYLNGDTNPYSSTRKKLADSLGVEVKTLPK